MTPARKRDIRMKLNCIPTAFRISNFSCLFKKERHQVFCELAGLFLLTQTLPGRLNCTVKRLANLSSQNYTFIFYIHGDSRFDIRNSRTYSRLNCYSEAWLVQNFAKFRDGHSLNEGKNSFFFGIIFPWSANRYQSKHNISNTVHIHIAAATHYVKGNIENKEISLVYN